MARFRFLTGGAFCCTYIIKEPWTFRVTTTHAIPLLFGTMIYLNLLFYLLFFFGRVAGNQLISIAARQANTTGDTQCTPLMCISGIVNGSSTTYILSSLGKQNFGWMAMGFGGQMANTPMVIMWINEDGSVTLSQRKAPGEQMPTVDPNPPRKATSDLQLSSLSTSKPQLAFTVPTNGDTIQQIIYAFGTTPPGSSSESAPLVQHVDNGPLRLDLTLQLNSTGSIPLPTNDGDSSGSFTLPFLPYQKLIIAHAVFCSVGFLILLPLGALLARYLRTFIPTWFKVHWIFQFALAGPTIIIGVSLGIASVARAGAIHLDDDHKRWGVALFILYFVQCGLGAFIHFIKKADRKQRPPQNYVHAIVGVAIIGLALYQVHSGYDYEWPTTTGRGKVPSGVNIVFWIWVALLPASYGLGLLFLPKQYRQEYSKVQTFEDRN